MDLLSVECDCTNQTPLHLTMGRFITHTQLLVLMVSVHGWGWGGGGGVVLMVILYKGGGGGDIINKQIGNTKASLYFIVTDFCVVQLNNLNLSLIVPAVFSNTCSYNNTNIN